MPKTEDTEKHKWKNIYITIQIESLLAHTCFQYIFLNAQVKYTDIPFIYSINYSLLTAAWGSCS